MSYCKTVTFKDQIHISKSCHINQMALSYFLHRWIRSQHWSYSSLEELSVTLLALATVKTSMM